MASKGVPLHIVFINGRISSGKDTQAKKLIDRDEKAIRISPGDIVREARDPNHPYHDILKEHFPVLNSGELVPAEIMVGIVTEIISQEREKGKETFIVTGFPRSTEYLDVLDPILKGYEDDLGAKIEFVFIGISEGESWKRTQARVKEHSKDNIELRPEDNPATFKRRNNVFTRDTIPAMIHLMDRGRLIRVSGMGNEDETQVMLRKQLGWEKLHPPHEGRLPTQARK